MIQNSKGKEHTVINAMGETSKQNPGKEGKSLWILDTGGTDHVACSISLFISYHKIKLVRVKLPNNQYVYATHAGTIFLSKNITLHNVLYIPDFTLNIIYVLRLISSLNCQLVFTHNICQIQEKNSLRMIGQAEIQNGLYHLYVDEENNYVYTLHVDSFDTVNNLDVWHCRMGHPSNRILDCLAKQYSYIHYNDKNICAPCHLAKQHKLPFLLSKTNSQNVFLSHSHRHMGTSRYSFFAWS